MSDSNSEQAKSMLFPKRLASEEVERVTEPSIADIPLDPAEIKRLLKGEHHQDKSHRPT